VHAGKRVNPEGARVGRSAGRVARRCIAGVAAVALLAPVPVLAGRDDAPPPDRAPLAPVDRTSPGARTALATPIGAAPSGNGASLVGDGVQLVTETAVAPAADPPPPPPAPRTFAERHPAQAMAVQDPADPATTRWALLIGINEYLGRVSDNIGSRQDAEDMRAHLLRLGWRDDHILLLTDRDATRAGIVEGLRWLADKTDPSSTAVFHYSGHSKKWYGEDVDGDGEVTDEGLWPTDDRFIVDSELVSLLAPVDARAMWISFATCNAAGFADHGLARPGRVLTFSSGEPQKSYEHPAWGNSVWGYLMIEEALLNGMADLDRNGQVSVEEAWTWARPRASQATTGQRYGPQDAVIVDDHDGELQLAVPGVTPAAAPARPAAADQPPPEPAAESAPAPEPEREPRRDGGYVCVLCG